MLYFVATPIGNLKDISFRAIETLKEVDIIACEDTRNSLKLLNHYDIKKKLIAYHKFNENNSSEGIIELLKSGKNIAVISDSGMPLISDPGYILVQKLKENNLQYTIIPGANASLCALILSGQDTTHFTFVGFLPEQNKEKKEILNEIKNYKSTLIFYVSPYNVKKDTQILFEYLGKRKSCFVNEITKLYEKTYDFVLGDEITFEPKGEYVLIVEGDKEIKENEISVEEELKVLISNGLSKNEAVKQVAKNRKVVKNEIYQKALKLDN